MDNPAFTPFLTRFLDSLPFATELRSVSRHRRNRTKKVHRQSLLVTLPLSNPCRCKKNMENLQQRAGRRAKGEALPEDAFWRYSCHWTKDGRQVRVYCSFCNQPIAQGVAALPLRTETSRPDHQVFPDEIYRTLPCPY